MRPHAYFILTRQVGAKGIEIEFTVAFYVFYLHIATSAIIFLIFLPTYTDKILDDINNWIPYSQYITNEKSILETGKPSGYFIQRRYPDLFKEKNLTLKFLFKQELWIGCLIVLIIIGFLQFITHEILNFIISTNNPSTERYFIFTSISIDITSYWAAVLCMISNHISSIKKEIQHLKYIYSLPE